MIRKTDFYIASDCEVGDLKYTHTHTEAKGSVEASGLVSHSESTSPGTEAELSSCVPPHIELFLIFKTSDVQ